MLLASLNVLKLDPTVRAKVAELLVPTKDMKVTVPLQSLSGSIAQRLTYSGNAIRVDDR